MGGLRIDSKILWQEYVYGKQSYDQLAAKYGVSRRTIQRKLDSHSVTASKFLSDLKEVVVFMDCTFWGRGYDNNGF